GYGLLLPDIRDALQLDSAVLGLLATGSFGAYLAATAAAGALSARVGPRRLVVAGGCLAVLGMLLVAGARGALTLAVGLVVAGAGGMGATNARLVLALVGAASLAGAFSGELVERLGARPTIVVSALALSSSLALLAAAPGSWLAVVPSAILFGGAYNVLLAV